MACQNCMKTTIMAVALIYLSVLAQDFSDGYSRSIKLGLFSGRDSLNQEDTLEQELSDTARVTLLLKDMGDE